METNARNRESVASLESHLGYWLRRVSNAVSGSFSHALNEKQTSVAEWVLLRELYDGEQSSSGELADRLGLTRGAVSKIVDKLDAKGWIQTDAKEGDSRFRLLSLTRAGRRSLPVLAEIADQNDARYFGCLSAREKSVLRGLLIKLADHNHIRNVATE
jgi:DNA-binding MarR family transcriptional regulator